MPFDRGVASRSIYMSIVVKLAFSLSRDAWVLAFVETARRQRIRLLYGDDSCPYKMIRHEHEHFLA